MSSSFEERRRWIFVSHASADLKRVRQIRNYLEEKGGSPLLFHLLALSKVDEFWPIIEREIAARNFFLYCESVAAGKSEWVQKEREVVQRIEKPKPRIGSIQVDGPSLDYEVLDKFLMATKVFATYSHNDAERAAPFLEELDRFGYQLTLNRKVMPVEAMSSAGNWELEGAILEAAREGFVVLFLSARAAASQWVQLEVRFADDLGARFVPVLLEKISPEATLALRPAMNYQWFDATVDPATAPRRLVELLNARSW